MAKSSSNRILNTPSHYAKTHYYYPQEIGILQSGGAHISSRKDLHSFLFLLVLTGKGKLRYRGEEYALKQGDCAFLDCKEEYTHESDDTFPWELRWVHFYGRDADEAYRLFLNKNLPPVFHPINPASFNTLLSGLQTCASEDNAFRELLFHKALTELVTTCFTESAASIAAKGSAKQDKLDDLRDYIKSHYNERISLDQVAALFYISKYHMIRAYKKRFGITPTADLIAQRISSAKYLLRFDDKSIESVSESVGFRDVAYFIRCFKHLEGMTPLEYRQKW